MVLKAPRIGDEHGADADMAALTQRTPQRIGNRVFNYVVVFVPIGAKQPDFGGNGPADHAIHHNIRVFRVDELTHMLTPRIFSMLPVLKPIMCSGFSLKLFRTVEKP